MTSPGTNPAHLARNSDPESSHAAAEEAASSPAVARQRETIRQAVSRYPGKTSRELARLIPTLDRYQVARRLPELPEVVQVRKPLKRCSVSGRACCTWWPRVGQVEMFG